MAFCGSQVDEPAVRQHIDTLPVRHHVLLDKRPDHPPAFSQLAQGLEVQFDIEMTGISHDGTVFHEGEMFFTDNIDVAGYGTEKVTCPGGFIHGHNGEPVHNRFQCCQRINLCNHDVSTHAPCPHGQTPATPAIPADNKYRSSYQPICGTNNTVHGTLAGSVAVVKKVLCLGIVDGDNGILQHMVRRHAFEPDDAGCGLFRPALDPIDELGSF